MLSVTLAALLICPAGIEASGVPATYRPAPSIHQAVAQEAARLVVAARPLSAQQQPSPHRNWFARHPVLTGALAGAGVGMIVIAANGCDSSSDYTCTGLLLFGAGTGAAIGAAGGFVAGLILR